MWSVGGVGEGVAWLHVLSWAPCGHHIISLTCCCFHPRFSPLVCLWIQFLSSCLSVIIAARFIHSKLFPFTLDAQQHPFSLTCFIHSVLFSIDAFLLSPPWWIPQYCIYKLPICCPYHDHLSSYSSPFQSFFSCAMCSLYSSSPSSSHLCLCPPASILTAGLNHPRFCLPCHVWPPCTSVQASSHGDGASRADISPQR